MNRDRTLLGEIREAGERFAAREATRPSARSRWWSSLLLSAAVASFTPSVRADDPAFQTRLQAVDQASPSSPLIDERRFDDFIPRQEKTVEALTALDRSASRGARLSVNDRQAFDKMMVRSLNYLGLARIETGDAAGAEPVVLRALALSEKLPPDDDESRSFSLVVAGKLYRLKGDYARARQMLERALERKHGRGTSSWDVRLLLVDLSQIRRLLGDFAGARAMVEELIKTSLTDEQGFAEKAAVNLATGEYAPVEGDIARALYELRNEWKTPPEILDALGHAADFQLAMGSPERAEAPAKECLARREKVRFPRQLDIADAALRLARVYLAMRDAVRAAPLVERAGGLLEKAVPEDHPARIPLLAAKAEIAVLKDDLAAAEKLLPSALAIAERAFGPEHAEPARLLARIAAVRLRRGDRDGALAAQIRAAGTLEKLLGAMHPDTTNALDDLARIHVARGEIDRAVPFLEKAIDGHDRHAARIFAAASEAQKARTMEMLKPETDLAVHVQRLLPTNPDAARVALTAVLRRKGRVLDGMAMSRSALRDAGAPDERILMEQIISLQKQIVSLILRGPGSYSPEEHRAHIRELDEQKQKLEAQESRVSARHLLQDHPVTPRDVAEALPASSALVEIAQVSPLEEPRAARYTAYVLFPDASIRVLDLGEAAPLNARIAEARRGLSDPREDAIPKARALDDAVMRPIRGVLGEVRWLFVSPDSDLNLVPFGALVDERRRHLIERFSFTYLTSGRDLLIGQTIDAPAEPGPAAILFGNPDFGEKQLGRRRFAEREGEGKARGVRAIDMHRIRFVPLESTATEVSAVRERVPGAQALMGEEATEARLKAVRHPRILHLATHGFFLPDKRSSAPSDEDPAAAMIDSPLVRSGIALAGANLLRSGEEDGVLTALEAAGLDLYGTKLVVLSACDTGVGEARSGEGVYGLRRAFAMAGAETTVMSLWKVDDEGTRDLMIGYYDRLLKGGGRAESLRQAALSLKANPRYAHPFYWASFIVSGEGGALSGKQIEPAPPPVAPGPRGCACRMVERGDASAGPWLLLLLLGVLAKRRRGR